MGLRKWQALGHLYRLCDCVHLMTPLVPEIDASLCDLAAGVSNTIETGQQSASAAVNDFLSTVPSSLYPTPGASTGYSLDASFVAAILGVLQVVSVFGGIMAIMVIRLLLALSRE